MNNNDKFQGTKIECDIAGFNDEEMTPLFADALELVNVYLLKLFHLCLHQDKYQHQLYNLIVTNNSLPIVAVLFATVGSFFYILMLYVEVLLYS